MSYARCYVKGQYQSWARKGYYAGTLLQLVKYTTGMGIPELDFKMDLTYDLGINISPFNGPGTYTCDPSTKSGITYSLSKMAFLLGSKTTENYGSSATVIFTSIAPEGSTIKDTFTAFLVQGRPALEMP